MNQLMYSFFEKCTFLHISFFIICYFSSMMNKEYKLSVFIFTLHRTIKLEMFNISLALKNKSATVFKIV